MVCDDTGRCDDFKKWWQDTHGGFPEVGVVPPNSKIQPLLNYIPGISKDAKFASVGVLVSYEGVEQEINYWFKRIDVFKISRDEQGNAVGLNPIDLDISWDQNGKKSLPKLIMPDWKKYKKSTIQ